MTERHLHSVDTEPPDVEDDDDEGGGDDESCILVELTISGSDDIFRSCRAVLDPDTSAEDVAQQILMTVRGAIAAYNVDVQLAFERRLLHWGDPNER